MSRPPLSPTVTVAIVTHDSAVDLPDCLRHVAELRGVAIEVVIVDCASQDATVAAAREYAPAGVPMSVVELEHNIGFAGGMNAAIEAARAPNILSLNADARPCPDYAARLLEALDLAPKVGAVTGRLKRFSTADQPARLDACGMRLTPAWRHLDRGSDMQDHGQWSRLEEVFGGTGAATLFSRDALDDVAVDGEFFLEEFHSFREDAELSFRLRERGWLVVYQPAAEATHRRFNLPRRRAQLPATINCHSLKNRYLLRAYHQTLGNLLWTFIPCLWRDFLALGYVLTSERSSLAAYRWLWRNRRHILQRRRRIQARRTRPAREIDRWFLRRGIPLAGPIPS